ncbi:MAG: M28 family peptidase, partial [Clostridia bacterium]|nr:M28 family peptidase [Clostridia bacterium]
MYNTIKKYISCFSVTGSEKYLADVIAEDMAPYADSITTDPMGNLICFKKGKDSSKRMMFAAHMDEIGFVVTYIEKNGYIRVSNVGGINAVASSSHEVEFINGTKGVLIFESGTSEYNVKKLYVDIGAKDRKDAEKKVHVGDYLALTQNIVRLGNRRIAGKAMDDRLGCAVIAEAAKLIKTPAYDTYFVFTTQEEVGLRGSKAAANA